MKKQPQCRNPSLSRDDCNWGIFRPSKLERDGVAIPHLVGMTATFKLIVSVEEGERGVAIPHLVGMTATKENFLL